MMFIAAGAVLIVLLAGLWNMGRPNSSASLSQRLMRWRVALQFVAIVVALVLFMFDGILGFVVEGLIG